MTTDGMLVVAVCGWLLLRGRRSELVTRSLRMALPFTLIAVIATMGFGDGQGRLMVQQEPMKMAAAEGVYHSGRGQAFQLLTTAAVKRNPGHVNNEVGIPHLLSLIEDLRWNGEIKGMDNIQVQERRQYV